MKKILRRATLATMAFCATLITLCSCGGNGLEKAVKEAFLKGDTTEARYESLCAIIKAAPDQYSNYIDEQGTINVEELGKFINQVGSSLRPSMTWNIATYGMKDLTLTIYFERSGSMVPYDNTTGGGQLKKAVNDLINFFPCQSGVSINIVNDDIYPYKGTIGSFLQDRNIYATTQGTGNAAYTDFKLIFEKIFSAQRAGNVSILVTDMIYSPKNTQGVSVEKIMNEENSLATSIFKQYKGKSIIVNKLQGDFDGMYYPYNGHPFHYKGQRPFYVIVIADATVIDRMVSNPKYSNFLNLSGVTHSYRFNQAQSTLKHHLVPTWKGGAGRLRESRGGDGVLTHCEGDRETGILAFTIAVNLNGLNKSEDFLKQTSNYGLQSQNGFKITAIERIAPTDINGNNKSYLEGMTHVITLAGKLNSPRDEIKIALRNDYPAWIATSTCNDDTNPVAGNFAHTTFGLNSFLRGIYDAFSAGDNNYGIINLKLEK